jgi:hypothetical protein
MLAANMSAGQSQAMAQAIGQRHARLDIYIEGFAVGFKFY